MSSKLGHLHNEKESFVEFIMALMRDLSAMEQRGIRHKKKEKKRMYVTTILSFVFIHIPPLMTHSPHPHSSHPIPWFRSQHDITFIRNLCGVGVRYAENVARAKSRHPHRFGVFPLFD